MPDKIACMSTARIAGLIVVLVGITVVLILAFRSKPIAVPAEPLPKPSDTASLELPAIRLAKGPIVGAIVLGNLISALLIAIAYSVLNWMSH